MYVFVRGPLLFQSHRDTHLLTFTYAGVSILQFPASQSPKFAFAYQLCAIFGGSCIEIIGIICWLQRREERKRETIEEEIIETSEKEEKEEK